MRVICGIEFLQLSDAFLSFVYTRSNCASSSASSKLLLSVFDRVMTGAIVEKDSPERGVAATMLVRVFDRLLSLLCNMTGGGI
jgi:hypothetical protein